MTLITFALLLIIGLVITIVGFVKHNKRQKIIGMSLLVLTAVLILWFMLAWANMP